MSNRQNYDPNAAFYQCTSLILSGDQQMEGQNAPLNVGCFQNDPNQDLIHKNAIVFDRLDLLAIDSLCTVSRGSLDIANDPPSIEVHTNTEEEPPSTFKPSHKSFIFQDIEHEEDSERKLIVQTQELTLRSQQQSVKEDIFNEYSPHRHRPLVKNQRHKLHHIKHAKQLIRELKREHKYTDRILADVVLTCHNKIQKVRAANIDPIITDKGHLSGLIVTNAHTELKIKVVNLASDSFDPKLELWDERQECWTEFDFKIKIRSG